MKNINFLIKYCFEGNKKRERAREETEILRAAVPPDRCFSPSLFPKKRWSRSPLSPPLKASRRSTPTWPRAPTSRGKVECLLVAFYGVARKKRENERARERERGREAKIEFRSMAAVAPIPPSSVQAPARGSTSNCSRATPEARADRSLFESDLERE